MKTHDLQESKEVEPFESNSLLGNYASRSLLNVVEAAVILGRSADFIRGEIECGRLHAHGVPGRKKERKMVTTRSLVLYVAETAEYEGADYRARVRELFGTWTPEQRKWALDQLAAMMTR